MGGPGLGRTHTKSGSLHGRPRLQATHWIHQRNPLTAAPASAPSNDGAWPPRSLCTLEIKLNYTEHTWGSYSLAGVNIITNHLNLS